MSLETFENEFKLISIYRLFSTLYKLCVLKPTKKVSINLIKRLMWPIEREKQFNVTRKSR
jgi:hypothetical protein